MRERAAMIGGRLRFTSPPTGGTSVELRVRQEGAAHDAS
jgi:signal transduction histidine kinase